MRGRTVLGLAALALVGCGGDDGGVDKGSAGLVLDAPEAVPVAPFRFFNAFASRTPVTVEANGRPLVGAEGESTVRYEGSLRFDPAPTRPAQIVVRAQPGETILATRTADTSEPDARFTVIGFGEPGAEKTIVMDDDGMTNSVRRSIQFRFVDMLTDPGTHYSHVRFKGELLAFSTSETQTGENVRGFIGLDRTPGEYTFTLRENGDIASRPLVTIQVPIDYEAPVTLLLYGSIKDPRCALLRGRYFNLDP